VQSSHNGVAAQPPAPSSTSAVRNFRDLLTHMSRPVVETTVGPRYPWRIFWVLLIAAICGFFAVLPYAFEVLAKLIKARALPMSLPVFVLVQGLQSTIIFGLVVGVGLLLARKVGIGTPLLRSWLYREPSADNVATTRVAMIAGLLVGVVSLILFYGIFIRYAPGWPSEAGVPIWKRLLACIYGAIDEELLLRLFLLGLVLWIAGKITRTNVRATPLTFWIANGLVALIFGAAHLPTATSLMQVTPAVVIVIMTLNSGAGAVFGYLAWTRGLEAAIIAHFVSDLVAHLVGPLFGP
jgi:hypothetical protein